MASSPRYASRSASPRLALASASRRIASDARSTIADRRYVCRRRTRYAAPRRARSRAPFAPLPLSTGDAGTLVVSQSPDAYSVASLYGAVGRSTATDGLAVIAHAKPVPPPTP
ncbi:MAG: hypothetical protein NVSMB21_07060 [Vulcanimicrobiaceae bacterium]